jgi:hypothetical protein
MQTSYTMTMLKRTAALLIVFSIVAGPVFAQRTKTSQRAGEQRKAEKGLKENRFFFYFINASISNFGSDEDKARFKEAIQRDILSQLLYMRFNFRESYIELRRSQKILIDLYVKTLNADIGRARSLLNGFAAPVIESKVDRARSYLWLGYRDMKSAETNLMMGDNYQESLYAMRLWQYVKSIKLAKNARRYAFLAAIEIALPYGKRKLVNRPTYDEVEKNIKDLLDQSQKDYYLLVHMDNHYRFKDKTSFYDAIWDNPALQELDEYKKYLGEEEIKKNDSDQ